MHYNVIIIGAGASGLFCAAECGKRGRSVLVIDHADRIASKVLISGGGRCNLTNLDVGASHYFSENQHFCKSALARFTPRDILALLERYHIAYYEKEAGQIFCVKTSRDVAGMLLTECERAKVSIRLSCKIKEIKKTSSHFAVTTTVGAFTSDSLVVATGGLSYPDLGATGFGHAIARQFGLKVTSLRPTLTPFLFEERDRKAWADLAGISLNVEILCGKNRVQGSMLFTHRGLSGPAVLQTSLRWSPGLPLTINLLPELDFLAALRAVRSSKKELHTFLGEFFPKRLAQALCDHLSLAKPVNQLSDKELRTVADAIHAWTLTPRKTEGYRIAEATVGGVSTEELSSKTMEAKNVPGLFFIGEVLDVTGELGGYNLHWAWASGFVAGQHA